MLVVKCPCGAKLKAKHESAGKKAKCPHCGAALRIPPAPATVASAPHAAEASPLDLLEQLASSGTLEPAGSSDDLLSGLADGERVEVKPVIPAAPAPAANASSVGYARDAMAIPNPLRTSHSPRDAISGPTRSFWHNAGFAFLYPVASSGNAINFVILCVMTVLGFFCRFAGCIALFGGGAIYGWTAAVFMSIVLDTAAGEDDMPGIRMEEGPVGDILIPGLKFFATYALASLPMIAYVVLVETGVIKENVFLFFMWLTLGIFLWPLFMLLFSLGA